MILSRSCVATLLIAGCFGSAPELDDDTGSTTAPTSTTTPSTDDPTLPTSTSSETSSADTTSPTSSEPTSDSASDTSDATCVDAGPVTDFGCGNDAYEPGEICHAGAVIMAATQGSDIAVIPRGGDPADLVVPNADMMGPGLTYLLNDGSGAFERVPVEGVVAAYSVRAAQLDGGGALDLVVGLPAGAQVLLGQGGGLFDPGDLVAPDGSATRVGFGQLDNGESLDIFRVSADIATWFTHLNMGGGTFASGLSGSLTAVNKSFAGATDVVVGSFGAFDDDVVAAIVASGFVARIPLTGNGQPDVLVDPDGGGGDAVAIAAGDVDDDGLPDLVSAHGNRLRVHLASTSYGAPYDIPVDAAGVVHVDIADIDRDGSADLVTLARSPNRVVVMRDVFPPGDAKPFELPLDAKSPGIRLAVAALDGDCVLDIAVAHVMGEVTILLSEP